MLFNIPNGLKRLSYKLTGRELNVLAVFDAEPAEFQKDCVYSIVAEVKGHFINELTCSVQFKAEGSIPKVEDLNHLLFARYEAEEY